MGLWPSEGPACAWASTSQQRVLLLTGALCLPTFPDVTFSGVATHLPDMLFGACTTLLHKLISLLFRRSIIFTAVDIQVTGRLSQSYGAGNMQHGQIPLIILLFLSSCHKMLNDTSYLCLFRLHLLTKHRVFSGPGFQLAQELGEAANGGQVLLSQEAWVRLRGSMFAAGFPVVEQLGLYKLDAWPVPIWVYQVSIVTQQPGRHVIQ